MIIVLARTIVVAEVAAWVKRKIAEVLSCGVHEVRVQKGSSVGKAAVTFSAPGIEAPEHQERLASIYQSAESMIQQRLRGLDTRRVRNGETTEN
jgi:hypothetical protein